MVTIALDAPLPRAIELMQEHGIRHLPVLDEEKLVGILSEGDLTAVEALEQTGLNAVTVAEAMTPEPYAVPASTSLAEVARRMADEKYGCAVIVDARGQVIDIFTTNDALRLLAEALPQLSVEDAAERAAR